MLTPLRAQSILPAFFAVGLSLVVSGCATRRASTPPAQTLSLGTYSSGFRDYAGRDLCAQDGTQLASELEDVHSLLAQFLQATSAGVQGVWAEEHLALLMEGQKSLPPVLDVLGSTYRLLPQCPFDPALGLAGVARQGLELTRQAGERLKESPELLEFGRVRAEIAQWEEAQNLQCAQSQIGGCNARPAPKNSRPVIYYASEDAQGAREWLFCDGAAVRAAAGGPPQFVGPAPGRKPKRGSRVDLARPYLEAAARYPPSSLVRSPKLPVRAKAQPPDEPEEPLEGQGDPGKDLPLDRRP
ncbi:MAG TPA: hypothetical protein VEY30_09835 [Myxococcaceae bacterium]|nr:hypothetical protein [Myxococcaceae bacterium]